MRLVLKYAKRTKSGGYVYRRRVPQDLLSIIGKREFKPALGKSEAVAVRAYARVHDAVEHQIRHARRALLAERGTAADNITPAERFTAAQGSVSDLLRGVVGLTDDEAREVIAEGIAAKYPLDPETGYAVGITDYDTDRLRLLTDANAECPKKTVEDAARLYVQERLGGGSDGESKKNAQRAERIVGYIQSALGKNRVLEELTREDGRKVRDFMLGVSKVNGAFKRPASVKREINQRKAIFNFAIHEFELTGKAINPFSKIEIPGLGHEAESEQRDPLPAEVIAAVRHRLGTAKPELGLIWRLLEGTGCRLAEITGSRVEDVDVGGEWPCIRVTWHEERRVKTKASRRFVPLVGDALLAAKEALQLSRSGPMLSRLRQTRRTCCRLQRPHGPPWLCMEQDSRPARRPSEIPSPGMPSGGSLHGGCSLGVTPRVRGVPASLLSYLRRSHLQNGIFPTMEATCWPTAGTITGTIWVWLSRRRPRRRRHPRMPVMIITSISSISPLGWHPRVTPRGTSKVNLSHEPLAGHPLRGDGG